MTTQPSHETSLVEAHRRLVHLYEISKLLTQIETVERTVQAVTALLGRSLSARTAVVVLAVPGPPKALSWADDEVPQALANQAEARALAAFDHFFAETPTQTGAIPAEPGPYILLPLVVEAHPVFGALQVEGAGPPNEQDLIFINAVVNQLAIALEWHATLAARQAMEVAHRLRAERDSRARENLLAVVSHDLRNQLGGILMGAQLLLRQAPEGDAGAVSRRNLDVILRSVTEMDQLIGDLLDTASIEAGQISLDTRALEVGSLVRDAVEGFENLTKAAGLHVATDLGCDRDLVRGDARRIQQVFANLVHNAIKYTPAGGRLLIRAQASPSHITFSVADNGAGILASDLPHVFDRFWQGSKLTRPGTGLGLTIVRGIIEAHRGTVWIESREGGGTTVFFTLERWSQLA